MEKSGGRDGSSQVGVVAAMRARDVSRPRDDEPVDDEPVATEPETGDYRAKSSARGGNTPEAS